MTQRVDGRIHGIAAGRFHLVAFFGTLIVAGCGADVYEQRVNETKNYFAAVERVDSNLFAASKKGDAEIRIPKQFAQLADPQPTLMEDGTVVEPTVDPRQPAIVDLTFPGLVAAWQAQVKTETAAGTEQKPAFIYLMNNHDILLGNDQASAPNFTSNVAQLLWETFEIPEGQRMTGTEQYPKQARGYFPQNTFSVANMKPQKAMEGVQYAVDLYAMQKGDVQNVIVCFVPVSIGQSERLADRISIMLEQFKSSGTPVAKPGFTPAAGGGQAAPRPGPSLGF